MKVLAIILNLTQLAIIIYIVSKDGLPHGDGDAGMMLIFVGASVFALLHIFMNGSGKNSSFIGLWIQRKKLEEQQKIDRLKVK
jgi:hypothetical protein